MGLAENFRNAFVGVHSPQARAGEQKAAMYREGSGMHRQIAAALTAQGLKPTDQGYYNAYADMALGSGNEFLMEKRGVNLGDAQFDAILKPQANPLWTNDIKEYIAMTGDVNLENKGALASYVERANSSRGTNIRISPTIQAFDPNFANYPLDPALQDTYEYIDPAMRGKPKTNGALANGLLRERGHVTEGDRGKGNTFGTILTMGQRSINPLYGKDRLLSPEMRKRIKKGEWVLDSTTRNAYKDQFLIDSGPKWAQDLFLSDDGKALAQGSSLIAEPVLRDMSGAAAPDPDVARIKQMFVPGVHDTAEVSITKRVATTMLNSIYKGRAAGFEIDPFTSADVFLGQQTSSTGKSIAYGYIPATGQIYYALPNGTKAILTDEEVSEFLE